MGAVGAVVAGAASLETTAFLHGARFLVGASAPSEKSSAACCAGADGEEGGSDSPDATAFVRGRRVRLIFKTGCAGSGGSNAPLFGAHSSNRGRLVSDMKTLRGVFWKKCEAGWEVRR